MADYNELNDITEAPETENTPDLEDTEPSATDIQSTETENVTEDELPETEPAPLSGRARLEALFSQSDPDSDYSDDETFYAAFDRYDDDRNKELSDYDEFLEKLQSAVRKDPRVGLFLSNLVEGVDLASNLVNVLGTDLDQALNSEEYRNTLAEAQNEIAQFQEERLANLEASEETVANFFDSVGASDEQIEAFDQWLARRIADTVAGNITEEYLSEEWTLFNRDTDIADAREEGRIAGRNESISQRAALRSAGDGVPSLSQASQVRPSQQQNKPKPKSIWDVD